MEIGDTIRQRYVISLPMGQDNCRLLTLQLHHFPHIFMHVEQRPQAVTTALYMRFSSWYLPSTSCCCLLLCNSS